MSVAFRPHLAILKPVGQVVLSDNSFGNPEITGTGISVRGYREELSSSDAFNIWGIEHKNPSVLMVNLGDADAFTTGDEVLIGNRTYKVAGLAKLEDAGDVCDCALIPLTYDQYPLQDPTDGS